MTVKEMAAEQGVSEKTVRRDLETFQQVGFPLQEAVCEHGLKKWRIDPERNQPGLSFAFDEAIALYLARRLLEPLAGTPYWEAAQRAFKKIRSSLGEGALGYIERFGAVFYKTTFGQHDYGRKAEIIDRLTMAVEDRRAVFITYQSLRATEPVTYDLYPYGLVYHRGALYLVGWAVDHKEIRHWKMDRVEAVELTQIHFQRSEDFDLRRHLAGSFGVYHGKGDVCIRVRFSKTVARYVLESKWHESQRLLPQKDGSLVAEFRLSDTEEVKSWILSFGQHAVVLAPERFANELRNEATEMLRAYSLAFSHDEQQSPSMISE
jgi:predicted DNA-binding transcriptional regulator YafY